MNLSPEALLEISAGQCQSCLEFIPFSGFLEIVRDLRKKIQIQPLKRIHVNFVNPIINKRGKDFKLDLKNTFKEGQFKRSKGIDII